jgi:hypothetical protein
MTTSTLDTQTDLIDIILAEVSRAVAGRTLSGQ